MLRERYVVTGALVLVLAACERPGTSQGSEPAASDTQIVASVAPVGTLPEGVAADAGEEGREVYRRNCVVCHGEQGEGTALGPALNDATWLAGRTGGFEEIITVVREGVAAPDSFPVPMPGGGDGILSDAQIRSVAAYTYSIGRRP